MEKERTFQSPQKGTNLNNFLTSSNWRMQWRISCQAFLRIMPSYYSAHQNDEHVLFGESLPCVSWSKISSVSHNFFYQNGRLADGLRKKAKPFKREISLLKRYSVVPSPLKHTTEWASFSIMLFVTNRILKVCW